MSTEKKNTTEEQKKEERKPLVNIEEFMFNDFVTRDFNIGSVAVKIRSLLSKEMTAIYQLIGQSRSMSDIEKEWMLNKLFVAAALVNLKTKSLPERKEDESIAQFLARKLEVIEELSSVLIGHIHVKISALTRDLVDELEYLDKPGDLVKK